MMVLPLQQYQKIKNKSNGTEMRWRNRKLKSIMQFCFLSELTSISKEIYWAHENDVLRKKDRFPKTVTEAFRVLSGWKKIWR